MVLRTPSLCLDGLNRWDSSSWQVLVPRKAKLEPSVTSLSEHDL
jgi:hypothetical protein